MIHHTMILLLGHEFLLLGLEFRLVHEHIYNMNAIGYAPRYMYVYGQALTELRHRE